MSIWGVLLHASRHRVHAGGTPAALQDPQCKFVIGTGILRYYLFNWQVQSACDGPCCSCIALKAC